MSKLVLNIEPATYSDIRAMTDHELNRTPDGASDIDPSRSHLNEILHGPESQQAALEALWARGVKKPTAQAEAPFVQIVISASPSYFRPHDPDRAGEWDETRLRAWRAKTLQWLRDEFGEDFVHGSLHLDETTPHIHALIVPTYEKKPRKPGKRNLRKKETEEEFEMRLKEYEQAETVRTVGRASNTLFKQKDSFTMIRRNCAKAVASLGIEYGDDYSLPDAAASPTPLTTRQWVKEKTKALNDKEIEISTKNKNFVKKADKWLKDQRAGLDEIASSLDDRATTLDEREAEAARAITQAREAKDKAQEAQRAAEVAQEKAEAAQRAAETLAEGLVGLMKELTALLTKVKAHPLLKEGQALFNRMTLSPTIKAAIKRADKSLSAKKPTPEAPSLDDEGLSL